MRITVGGVLILTMGGALAYWGLADSRLTFTQKLEGFSQEAHSLFGLFKSGDAEKTVLLVPSETPVQTALPLESIPLIPEVTPIPVAPANPVVKPRSRKRRRAVKKKAKVTTAKKIPKKAATTKQVEPLVGTYVSVELKTGRTILGVLEEKTATAYKIQLPGLGPFEYPLTSVKSIKPAE